MLNVPAQSRDCAGNDDAGMAGGTLENVNRFQPREWPVQLCTLDVWRRG